jgi:hypothetical protein
MNSKISPLDRKPKNIIWIHGPYGHVKSQLRLLIANYYYSTNNWSFYTLLIITNQLWLENYQGEKAVLLDRYPGWSPFHLFLQFIDEYPIIVQVKFSSFSFFTTFIIINSIFLFLQIYLNTTEAGESLFQLFHKIKKMI